MPLTGHFNKNVHDLPIQSLHRKSLGNLVRWGLVVGEHT